MVPYFLTVICLRKNELNLIQIIGWRANKTFGFKRRDFFHSPDIHNVTRRNSKVRHVIMIVFYSARFICVKRVCAITYSYKPQRRWKDNFVLTVQAGIPMLEKPGG